MEESVMSMIRRGIKNVPRLASLQQLQVDTLPEVMYIWLDLSFDERKLVMPSGSWLKADTRANVENYSQKSRCFKHWNAVCQKYTKLMKKCQAEANAVVDIKQDLLRDSSSELFNTSIAQIAREKAIKNNILFPQVIDAIMPKMHDYF